MPFDCVHAVVGDFCNKHTNDHEIRIACNAQTKYKDTNKRTKSTGLIKSNYISLYKYYDQLLMIRFLPCLWQFLCEEKYHFHKSQPFSFRAILLKQSNQQACHEFFMQHDTEFNENLSHTRLWTSHQEKKDF